MLFVKRSKWNEMEAQVTACELTTSLHLPPVQSVACKNLDAGVCGAL